MTLRHVTWALDLEGVDAIARMILVTIGEEADESGAAAPGLPKLARRADCSVDTVRRRISDLARRGLLDRLQRQREDGGNDRVLIRLRMDPAPRASAPPRPMPPPSNLQGPPLAACEGPPLAACDRGPDVGVGEASEPQAAAALARAEPEPQNPGSYIPPLPPKTSPTDQPDAASAAPGEGAAEVEPDDGVQRFLEAWPLGPFEPPAPVERAWNRLADADRRAALAGAPKFRDACKRAGKRPGSAAQYLRQRKWEARAAGSKTAAQGGVWVILGTDGGRAWLERKCLEKPGVYANGWPSWLIKPHPETGQPAVFMPTLFPPKAHGSGEAA